MNQIAVVNQAGKAYAERVIVLPAGNFDALIGRPGYHQRDNGDCPAAEPPRARRHESTRSYMRSNFSRPTA